MKGRPPRRLCARFSSSLSHIEDTRLKDDRNLGYKPVSLLNSDSNLASAPFVKSGRICSPLFTLLLYEKCYIFLDLTALRLITAVLELHLNMRPATFWCHCSCFATSSRPLALADAVLACELRGAISSPLFYTPRVNMPRSCC